MSLALRRGGTGRERQVPIRTQLSPPLIKVHLGPGGLIGLGIQRQYIRHRRDKGAPHFWNTPFEGAWRRGARARAQGPSSAARGGPLSGGPAQSPAAGGRPRGV